MSKLRTVSLFSGIGAFEKALTNTNIPYEIIGISEWEVNAIISYDAIHTNDGIDYTENMSKEEILDILDKFTFSTDGKKPCDLKRLNNKKLRQLYNAHKRTKNLGDVSKIKFDEIKDVDLVVGGSPCQDFSLAGYQKGSMWTCNNCHSEYNPLEQHYSKRNKCIMCNSENINKTSSSLIVEYLRAIRDTKPKFFMYENVKNLIGKKFKDGFDLFYNELNEYGYNIYYQVLNSKNYGIPQSRDRIFVVGVLKEHDSVKFEFPKPFDSGLRLKHFLEKEVDEKYYISDERADKLLKDLDKIKLKNIEKNDIRKLGNLNPSGNGISGEVFDVSGVSPTLTRCDYKDAKKIVEENKDPIILDDFYTDRSVRPYNENCPTLRSDRYGLKVVECINMTRKKNKSYGCS